MVLPDTARISSTLREFKVERQQLAIVMDEYGSVDGIVTLENLLEEIVGEISDEADSDSVEIQPADDGSFVLPGVFPIHDLMDLGVSIDSQDATDYTTIAGFVIMNLGRIPDRPGDRIDLKDWTIEVL